MEKLTLVLQKETMAFCHLSPQDEIPGWVFKEPFFCITHTADELSLFLPQDRIPKHWKIVGNWRIFKISGPLDFNLIGVIASMANPLATASIPINAISTFDTDYIMVQSRELEQACEVLEFEGFKIIKD
jgi:uncharacterized protein